MRGKTLEQTLSDLPPTQESIERIKLSIAIIKEDIDTTENQERKRILKLNLATCKKRLEELNK